MIIGETSYDNTSTYSVSDFHVLFGVS